MTAIKQNSLVRKIKIWGGDIGIHSQRDEDPVDNADNEIRRPP